MSKFGIPRLSYPYSVEPKKERWPIRQMNAHSLHTKATNYFMRSQKRRCGVFKGDFTFKCTSYMCIQTYRKLIRRKTIIALFVNPMSLKWYLFDLIRNLKAQNGCSTTHPNGKQ